MKQTNLFSDTDNVLPEEIRKTYVSCGGDYCPFCKSPEVSQDGFYYEAYDIDKEQHRVICSMMCHTCGKEWNDIYGLIGVSA